MIHRYPDSPVFYRRLDRAFPLAVAAEGCAIFDDEGRRYLDFSGGAMVANLGHGVTEVAEAMAEAARLGYVNGTQFTHRFVEELAAELVAVLPDEMRRAYFLCSGSEAVEAAVKLARQVWWERGRRGKWKVISRVPSYHGNTLTALSLSGREHYRAIYGPLLTDFPRIPAPDPYRRPDHPATTGEALEEEILRQGPETVAAFLAEPIGGSSTGAVAPDPGYWRRVAETCRRHDVLLIADEVLTGIGRTGRWLAADHYGLVPDVVVLGKGISGGMAPLSALAAREELVADLAARQRRLQPRPDLFPPPGYLRRRPRHPPSPQAPPAGGARRRAGDDVSRRPEPAPRRPPGGRRPRPGAAGGGRTGRRPRQQGALRAVGADGRAPDRRRLRPRAGGVAQRRPRRRPGRRARRPDHAGTTVYHHPRRDRRSGRAPPRRPGGPVVTEPKITYVSLASSPEFHAAFESAVAAAEKDFGRLYPCSIGGEGSATGRSREVRSPIDRRVLVGRIEQASAAEAARAVEIADRAFPAWRALGWRRRVEVLRRGAELISQRRLELAATMAWEVGKNRIEATAEVEEAADLLRYYCDLMERADGYRFAMARVSPHEATESVYLPYGVWGVVSPFNFPTALAAGMVAGALVTGNTVVLKPSQDAPLSGALLCQALWDGGVPRGVLHLVMGPGGEVGDALLHHPRTQGMAFTGSFDVGMGIYRGLSRDYPRPVVVEMGGKNPTVVTAAADLEAAAPAVARAAFGFGGQKCSACSRVYVEAGVAAEFTERLLAATRGLTVGNPLRREIFLGPLIHGKAVESFAGYVAGVRAAGGKVLAGGGVVTDGDLAHGHYVEPTVANLPDPDHPYFYEEMFVPLLLVQPVAGLDEALTLCNRAPYGLTAGLFSSDAGEVARFLDGIEAGVTYVNRKSGSTTGAWPGVNPFGGWKASGGTGPAALGPHYLLKFVREQSRTVNDVTV